MVNSFLDFDCGTPRSSSRKNGVAREPFVDNRCTTRVMRSLSAYTTIVEIQWYFGNARTTEVTASVRCWVISSAVQRVILVVQLVPLVTQIPKKLVS